MKRTRDKTRIYSIPHDAQGADTSPIIDALHYDIVGSNKVIIIKGLYIDQRCHTFSFSHYASSAWCIMRYIFL